MPMRRRFSSRSLLALGVIAASLGLVSEAGAVPATVRHQGRLYSEKGAPITDTLVVVFNIYDSEDAETSIWSEAHTIAFEDGYFSVLLGDNVPFDKMFE